MVKPAGATTPETPLEQTPSALGEEPQSFEPAAEKPATDWLSALRRATPEIDAEQAAEEPIPGWMGADSEVSSQAIGGPQAYDQDIPDWLRETSAPPETAEEPPVAQAEDEGVPDWLKGLGAAAAGAAALSALTPEESTEPAPERPATDWLSALRRATPEIDAEQATEETVPGWMGADSEVSSQAIGGPQGHDQDIPDWLREAGLTEVPSGGQPEEESADWLRDTGSAFEVPTTPEVPF